LKTTQINILMYHSISEGAGPSCISPSLFREQLDILQACAYQAIPLATLPALLQSNRDLPSRSVVITFDDAFADFTTTAFPHLQARSWPATIFLPAAKMGKTNDWQRGRGRAQFLPLMSWETAADLGHRGIELGSHAINHTRLTQLPPEVALDEIVTSRRSIESITGCSVTSFAPPYGNTNRRLREEISKSYSLAVGTRLGRARPDSDLYNLPRIEMFYFQNPRHWRAYLEQGSTLYYQVRKALRSIRAVAKADW
jgi:peptidoglycan/xylan/chitin deacetylase (PgdA/CDA1 family)